MRMHDEKVPVGRSVTFFPEEQERESKKANMK